MVVFSSSRINILLELYMSLIETLKNFEKFILGEKKDKDHWKKYRKKKSN
tara:strand:- start:2155 stop:2304 length:150 start_codon:yes stop_codon:yes gene_type:complete